MDATTILDHIAAFEAQQADRCRERDIDVSAFDLSHVAVRCVSWNEYLTAREVLEERATANLENVWNGRPISKIVLVNPCRSPAAGPCR